MDVRYSAVAFHGSGEQPVPSCANVKLIKDELRGELGFQQHVVGDCGALSNEYKPDAQNWTENAVDAAAKSMAATTDLECEGPDAPTSVYGNATLGLALRGGRISVEQIDAALTRLFRSRMALGLLDFPRGHNIFDRLSRDVVVESDAHRQLAYDMAVKSFSKFWPPSGDVWLVVFA
jgi:beta-glucosidase